MADTMTTNALFASQCVILFITVLIALILIDGLIEKATNKILDEIRKERDK